MCVHFVLLAKGAALNVAADKGGESGPPEFSSDELSCFQEARMAGRFMIMAVLENGAVKGVVHRDVDMAFVGEDAGFDLPVCQPGMEGERNVLMHGLEGLKNEGVTCGGRWVKVLAALVGTSEGYAWVAAQWWETITMIAPSRRT